MSDPRTVARELTGLCDSIFPRLVPSIVVHVNREMSGSLGGCTPVSDELVKQSSLQRALLFEIGIVVAEMTRWDAKDVDWKVCVERAVERQRRFYDRKAPTRVEATDKLIAWEVAHNLNAMLTYYEEKRGEEVSREPPIPGYGWISNSVGDYAQETSIIEVKCTSKHFSSADYRQVAMYWLLSYIESLEKGGQPWEIAILLNPRKNLTVEIVMDEFMQLVSGGRSLLELVQAFRGFFPDVQQES